MWQRRKRREQFREEIKKKLFSGNQDYDVFLQKLLFAVENKDEREEIINIDSLYGKKRDIDAEVLQHMRTSMQSYNINEPMNTAKYDKKFVNQLELIRNREDFL